MLLQIFLVLYTAQTNELALESMFSKPILEPGEFHSSLQEFIRSRIPKLEVLDTQEDWVSKSEQLRREILEKVVFKGVPKEWYEVEPEVVWGDVIQPNKDYLIRKLRYQALPGLWIPALLYEPSEIIGKVPAILNVNGHVGPPGKSQDYEQLRCINLSKRGMIALHPEWLSFGELSGDDYKHNRLAYLDLCGVSGLSVFYLCIKRAVDVLVMHPNVDRDKIAMTGLSGGGWQTIVLSALDTRISLAVPNAGYIGMEYRVEYIEDVGDLEQNPTDLLTIADYPHLTAMLAPRPSLLIYNEKDDCCFQSHRARPSVFEPVIPFFRLYGKEDNFQFYNNTMPGTHNYDKDNREQFYKFINKHFAPRFKVDEDIPSETEILSYDATVVGIPNTNANFYTLASDILKDLPRKKGSQDVDPIERLKDILKFKRLSIQATTSSQADINGFKVKFLKLDMDSGLKASASMISRADVRTESVIIVSSDKGKSDALNQVREMLTNSTVIAIDPLFIGECVPAKGPVWQYAQMISAVGERALGIQVSQLVAMAEWVHSEYNPKELILFGIGPNASVASIMACAILNRDMLIDVLILKDVFKSFKELIQKHLDYENYSPLFCFGILEHFDIDDLIGLCSHVKIEDR